jgi:hypothetical protein
MRDIGRRDPVPLTSESDVDELFASLSLSPEKLQRRLPEWLTLQRLVRESLHLGRVEVLGWSEEHKHRLPLLAVSFGNPDPAAPVLGIYGGIHGLERIGAQVALQLLHSFQELLLWDQVSQETLKKIRVVFFPIVNPLGTYRLRRANPQGVDLMRNAPVDAANATFLVGGHRISPKLSWYRGPEGEPMQPESQALVDFTMKETFGSSRVITLDFHSGFGVVDQLWFPYASSLAPFPHLPELFALKEAFERTQPHHVYKIEQQAKNYTTHGDLWDHLHFEYLKKNPQGVYLPLTIEMGSWVWVKKNPWQIFNALGPFNPMVPHRLKRILRRHHALFDFLIRALISHEIWVPRHEEQRLKHQTRALELCYGKNHG